MTQPAPSSLPVAAHPASPAFAPRYELLDGLRGVAALTVVLAHYHVVDLGHEAVMVFFLISGYCIAGAATSRLKPNPGGIAAFVWRRLRRIYPPYALSLAFFAVTRLAREALGRGSGLSTDIVAWIQSLTLTQWLSLVTKPNSDPSANTTLFVAAHWSLNYEEQFYVIVALALLASRAVPTRFFGILALLTAASVGWNLLVFPGIYHGFFLEYWPHFSIGVGLFYVLCVSTARRARQWYAIALSSLVLACVAARLWSAPAAGFAAGDELMLIAIFALALLAMRPMSERIASSPAWLPLHFLGTISYSLYLVHQFNLTLSSEIGTAIARSPALHFLAVAIAVAVQLLIATVFWYFCERPFLNKKASA